MVSLLLELAGLACIVATVALFEWRLIPAVVGVYLMWTVRAA